MERAKQLEDKTVEPTELKRTEEEGLLIVVL
jgi:hypothetical protein